jgi:sugar phosphate isomerase/epimerase
MGDDQRVSEAAGAGKAPSELSFSTLNHCPLFGLEVDVVDQARAAAAAGFDLLSPDIFSLRACAARPGGIDELAAVLDDLGLGVLDIASLNIDAGAAPGSGGGGAGEANDLGEVLALARALRPRYVLARMAGALDDAGAAALAEAADALGEEGVGVVLEPSPISSLAGLAVGDAFLDRAGLVGAGLVLDSWHFFVGGARWDELGALYPARVAFVQVADGWLPEPGLDAAGLMAATLNRRALPGEGDFDLGRLRAALDDAGFAGPVCVEVMGEALRTVPVGEFAAAARASLDAAWA